MNKLYKIILLILLLGILAFSQEGKVTYTLDQAIQTALENNPGIKAKEAQLGIAKGKQIQARSFQVPKISLLTKYFYANNLPNMYKQLMTKVPVMSSTGPVPGEFVPLRPMAPFPGRARDVFQLDLNLQYPIYTFGKITLANRNSRILEDAYEDELEQTKAEIIFKVKVAFNNVLFLKKVIDVYQKSLKQLEEHLALAKKAYQEGVRSEFDILSFQSKIEEFKTTLVDLEGKKELALTGLKNLMALPMQKQIDCSGTLQIPGNITPEVEKEIDAALNNNFQIKSLRMKKNILKNLVEINKTENKPTVFIFGNYHIYHGNDFPPYDQMFRNGLAVGIGIKMNLFDGNYTHGKVEEARAQHQMVEEFEEGLGLQIRFKVKDILVRLENFESQMKAALVQYDVVKKAYQIAKIRYENGMITPVELNDAQLHVIGVEVKLVKIKKDMANSMAELNFIKGSLE